jgi:CheY-like chemotaxis protein
MGKVHLGSSIKIKTDLIFLDVMMSRLDGFEEYKYLKGNPEVSDIPFIFITTMGMPKDLLTGFKSGEMSITLPDLSTFKRCLS